MLVRPRRPRPSRPRIREGSLARDIRGIATASTRTTITQAASAGTRPPGGRLTKSRPKETRHGYLQVYPTGAGTCPVIQFTPVTPTPAPRRQRLYRRFARPADRAGPTAHPDRTETASHLRSGGY